MIALIALAFGQTPATVPTPPGSITDAPVFAEPIVDLMSARTREKVALGGTLLVEWDNMAAPPPIGSFIDVWTRKPTGPCAVVQKLKVVLGPDGEGDLKHRVPVLRVPTADAPRLYALPVAAWTLRSPDDTRDHTSIACK
jgi:hypothetical protein